MHDEVPTSMMAPETVIKMLARNLDGRMGSTRQGEMPFRTLGTTGEKVSVIGIGGSHIGESSVGAGEAMRILL